MKKKSSISIMARSAGCVMAPMMTTLYGILPYMEKGLYKCDSIKDFEKGRLLWILKVRLKCIHMYPYKREAEGNLTRDRREGRPNDGKSEKG